MDKRRARIILDAPTGWNLQQRRESTNWLLGGERLDEPGAEHRTHPWYMVLWLTGVDYFSTLGYQPGIALLAAGALSPIATVLLVAVTLLGALPVYSQVASRSFAGQGSIAMLENLLPGWRAKLFVLILLGFAATDFVITMTLSAADAAKHAVENPILHRFIGDHQILATLILLTLLAVVFLMGFREAIGIAAFVAVPYICLNLIVLIRGLMEIMRHPEYLDRWQSALTLRGDWTAIAVASALIFPKLALGLSGFETGVSVMPLIQGSTADRFRARPKALIMATRKLLAGAALIMSAMLLFSSFVTTLLVPEEAYRIDGPASGRAIAYLAHSMIGDVFGSVYDLSTILILWFAGASAMAGLLNLIPRYLPRFGMAPRWVAFRRPLVLILFAADVLVTIFFEANVEAQGGAYATGVLVLMLSASVAVAIAFRHEASQEPDKSGSRHFLSVFFWFVSSLFAFALVDNVIVRPDGVIIASIFIATIVLFSSVSRTWRSIELRVTEMEFKDDQSVELWREIAGKKVHLVPLRTFTPEARERKAAELRRHYLIRGSIAFVHVYLLDNRSEFMTPLEVSVRPEGNDYTVEVRGAIAIANSIAYISELLDPVSIFLGLTRQNLVSQALRYLFLGEGETGLMVYTILLHYWKNTPEEDVRPLIFLMSE